LGRIKHVPNHQPVGFHVIYDDFMKISWDESYQTDDRCKVNFGDFILWMDKILHVVDG
jgi:hypothetical protein